MLKVQWPFGWTRWAAALAGLVFSSGVARAQGCAMCYTSAATAKAGAIEALRSGILILLLPVLFMFAGIFVVIYRSRNRFAGTGEWTADQDRELHQMFIRRDRVEEPGLRERSTPRQVES